MGLQSVSYLYKLRGNNIKRLQITNGFDGLICYKILLIQYLSEGRLFLNYLFKCGFSWTLHSISTGLTSYRPIRKDQFVVQLSIKLQNNLI